MGEKGCKKIYLEASTPKYLVNKSKEPLKLILLVYIQFPISAFSGK